MLYSRVPGAEGEGKGAPGVYCSCMSQIHIVPNFNKISAYLRKITMQSYALCETYSGRFEVNIVSFKTINELQRKDFLIMCYSV